jgi:hypothetical protein
MTVETLVVLNILLRRYKPGCERCIFEGDKIPQHAFLQTGNKAVGPM